MTIDDWMELHEAGAEARALGLQADENPYLRPVQAISGDLAALAEWIARREAWNFGWEAENASREGSIAAYFESLSASSKN